MQAHWKHVRNSMPILLIFLCFSTTQAAGLPGSSSIQTTGSIQYPSLKVGIYAVSWNFNEYNADTIANTFDLSQSWWVGPPPSSNDPSAKMDQVHSLKPDYKALVYRNVNWIYDYWPDELAIANDSGWLLKNVNGQYVRDTVYSGDYLVDITNKSYQQWLGAKIESWLVQYPFFDGVFTDGGLTTGLKDWDGTASSAPLNPSTGTDFTDQEIMDGCAAMLNAIMDAIGPNKLVVANGIWNGAVWSSSQGNGYKYILSKAPRLNGVMSEGCFKPYGSQWLSEAEWLSSIDLVSWIQNNFLNESGKHFVAGCPASPSLPSGATTGQVMMYGFSSTLLSAKYSSAQNTVFFDVNFWNSTQYPTELPLVQRLGDLDMIGPIGNYYKVPSTSIYVRDFVKGRVLVNPSGLAFTVPLDGTYTDFFANATVASSVTILPHTGMILISP